MIKNHFEGKGKASYMEGIMEDVTGRWASTPCTSALCVRAFAYSARLPRGWVMTVAGPQPSSNRIAGRSKR